MVQPGVISHVLPTPQAAPLLARLAAFKGYMPRGWPKDMPCASLELTAGTTERQQAEVEALAADLRCLAACPVPCQALHLSLQPQVLLQLAAAVASLAATLTHLSLAMVGDSCRF